VIFSGNLTAVFGQGAEIAAVVKQYFRTLSIGFVLYMITSCLQGFLTGIGKPEKSMLIIIVYYIIVRIPAAMIKKHFRT
jgi:Na+-driven multidrug efflux pump